MMAKPDKPDALSLECRNHFAQLVSSRGVKAFSGCLGLTTRQVNRMLGGDQPNPIERLIRWLQSAEPECRRPGHDFICRNMGDIL